MKSILIPIAMLAGFGFIGGCTAYVDPHVDPPSSSSTTTTTTSSNPWVPGAAVTTQRTTTTR